ncbi:MAG: CoA-binding protein [Candidatus Solibacter sp.]
MGALTPPLGKSDYTIRYMTQMETVREFLAEQRFAFVGVSRQPKDFSRALFREFLARRYQPVPVHPEATEIEGMPCFPRLKDIQPPVEAALLMTSASIANVLVQECVAAGIKKIWFYRGAGQGAVTQAALDTCLANGITAVPGECPFMFFEESNWIHRLHGLVRQITRSYPR